MSELKLPDAISRRHLLEGDLDTSKAMALANVYLAEDREIEAVDFLAAADPATNDEARQALCVLQEAAIERGDVFLMRAASAGLGEEPSAATWRSLAEAAASAGRPKDVETAERLATVGAE